METHGGTTTHDQAPGAAAPTPPQAIWALAWSFVAGQVLVLARFGPRDDADWVGSALLGVVVVTFFAHGVLRARRVRFWIVVVLLVLGAVVGLVELVQQPDGWALAGFALSALQLYLLNEYAASEWFRWHRRGSRGGPSVSGLLLIAAGVGISAGIVAGHASAVSVNFHMSF